MAKILFATTAEGVKFYPVTITDAVVHIKGNTQKKLSEILDEIDYSGKADKVSGATNGNFAGLDANGNLTDSGKKAADFATAAQGALADSAYQKPQAGIPKTDLASGVQDSLDAADSAYQKPSAGIPKSDLSSGVQDSLDLADSAYQKPNTGIAKADLAQGVQDSLDAADSAIQSVAEGSTDGTIAVDGTDVAVHGLGSAAYENTTAFDAAGAAATAKSEVIGESTDASSASTIYGAKKKAEEEAAAVLGTAQDSASDNTVYGAKKYADSLVAGGVIYQGTVDGTTDLLPTTGYKKGDYYKVAAAGTYAGHTAQVGDALIANKDYASGATATNDWDLLQGSVSVSNDNKDLTIGSEVLVATVEGTQIKVKQVEDMTKIEAVAVADTTEYADVTSLFTAPAGN